GITRLVGLYEPYGLTGLGKKSYEIQESTNCTIEDNDSTEYNGMIHAQQQRKSQYNLTLRKDCLEQVLYQSLFDL
ncbi:MAG: hypothetical protein ACRC1D_04440, partial [Culicoidibacterales bacterium]